MLELSQTIIITQMSRSRVTNYGSFGAPDRISSGKSTASTSLSEANTVGPRSKTKQQHSPEGGDSGRGTGSGSDDDLETCSSLTTVSEPEPEMIKKRSIRELICGDTHLNESHATTQQTKDQLRFPAPYTYTFRVIHSSSHLLGSIFYLVAGPTYYPSIDDLFLGGLFFIIGSCGFVIADTMDWWLNNRVGCFCDSSYIDSYETRLESYLDDKDTVYGRLQRTNAGINSVISIIGSITYLIGSVCYLPSILDIDPALGAYYFIYGSVILMVAQGWRMVRNVAGDPVHLIGPHNDDIAAKEEVIPTNWLLFADDLWIFTAAFCYLYGSILFLPKFDVDNYDTTIAANWFVFAGIFYCLGSFTLIYRYFFTTEFQ